MEEIEEGIPAEEHHEMRAFAGVEPKGFVHGRFMSTMTNESCAISYTVSAKVWLYILITVTCVPLIVGGAFTSIFIEDNNVHAAVGAFFTAALSLGSLSLFLFHLLGKIEKYHDHKTLNGLKILGMMVSVISGLLLGVYTILAFLHNQAFKLQGENYFSAAVFSGLCLTSSLQLYIAAQWYQNALQRTGSLSLPTQHRQNIIP